MQMFETSWKYIAGQPIDWHPSKDIPVHRLEHFNVSHGFPIVNFNLDPETKEEIPQDIDFVNQVFEKEYNINLPEVFSLSKEITPVVARTLLFHSTKSAIVGNHIHTFVYDKDGNVTSSRRTFTFVIPTKIVQEDHSDTFVMGRVDIDTSNFNVKQLSFQEIFQWYASAASQPKISTTELKLPSIGEILLFDFDSSYHAHKTSINSDNEYLFLVYDL